MTFDDEDFLNRTSLNEWNSIRKKRKTNSHTEIKKQVKMNKK